MDQEKIKVFYDKYLEILKLEKQELGCKSTELRHLIGRLGEFHCAIKTNGKLAHTPNQHGFDVISGSGKRVSVKTTAQKTGFVSINKKTIELFDEVMILQLVGFELNQLYYGTFQKIAPLCRTWSGNPDKYELDISKLKNIE